MADPDTKDQIVCMTNERVSFWNSKMASKDLDSAKLNKIEHRVYHSYDIVSHGYVKNMSADEHSKLLNTLRDLPRSRTEGIPGKFTAIVGKIMVITTNLYRSNELVVANSEYVKILDLNEKFINVETSLGDTIKLRPVSRHIFLRFEFDSN